MHDHRPNSHHLAKSDSDFSVFSLHDFSDCSAHDFSHVLHSRRFQMLPPL